MAKLLEFEFLNMDRRRHCRTGHVKFVHAHYIPRCDVGQVGICWHRLELTNSARCDE